MTEEKSTFKIREASVEEIMKWQLACQRELPHNHTSGLLIQTKKDNNDFYTEEDRKRYIKDLQDEYKEEKITFFGGIANIMMMLNINDDKNWHPNLGSFQAALGGIGFLLFMVQPGATLFDIALLLGSSTFIIAGANNMDPNSTYRGPFVTLLTIPLIPFIAGFVTVTKILEKLRYKRLFKNAKTKKLVNRPEVQVELDKAESKKQIDDTIDLYRSHNLNDVISEIKNLEGLILSISTGTTARHLIAELTTEVSTLFEEYKNGSIKNEDMLKEFKKRTSSLRGITEELKSDELRNNIHITDEPLSLKRRQEKEAN